MGVDSDLGPFAFAEGKLGAIAFAGIHFESIILAFEGEEGQSGLDPFPKGGVLRDGRSVVDGLLFHQIGEHRKGFLLISLAELFEIRHRCSLPWIFLRKTVTDKV